MMLFIVKEEKFFYFTERDGLVKLNVDLKVSSLCIRAKFKLELDEGHTSPLRHASANHVREPVVERLHRIVIINEYNRLRRCQNVNNKVILKPAFA